ncbi:hypothetical protein HMI56_006337 [Coelomomyces lativittatus]|nr:hypothetical protein HMI56_006337 [Coelomomyces lativittatus]
MTVFILKCKSLISAGTKSGLKQWAIFFFLFQAFIRFFLQCIFSIYLYLAPDQLPSELKKQGTIVFVYNLLDMFPIVFQILNVLESVVSSNTIQLMALNFLNLGPFATWTYLSFPSLHCFLSTPQMQCDYFLFEFFIFSFVLSLVFITGTCYISLKLRKFYNWTLYKQLGADKQVLIALLILGFSIVLCMKALNLHNQRYMMGFITCHVLRLFYVTVSLYLLLIRPTIYTQGKYMALVSLVLCIASCIITVIFAIKFIYYFDPDLSWDFAYSSMVASDKTFHHSLGV